MALISSMFLAGCASMREVVRLQQPVVEGANSSWNPVMTIPLDSSLEVHLESDERIRGRFRSADEQTLILEDGGVAASRKQRSGAWSLTEAVKRGLARFGGSVSVRFQESVGGFQFTRAIRRPSNFP